MPKLKTDDGGWRRFLIFGVKNCMAGCYQKIGAIIIARIKWYRKYETLHLNIMLFNGSAIPNFIDGFVIILAEINSVRM